MSATPSTETSALSLISAMKSLPSGGRMVRIAWGKTISRNLSQPESPSALAASIWPASTAWMPARNTSAMNAE